MFPDDMSETMTNKCQGRDPWAIWSIMTGQTENKELPYPPVTELARIYDMIWHVGQMIARPERSLQKLGSNWMCRNITNNSTLQNSLPPLDYYEVATAHRLVQLRFEQRSKPICNWHGSIMVPILFSPKKVRSKQVVVFFYPIESNQIPLPSGKLT